jgi:4-diphosphocytidyl-2-C-methyl-D-erythritol kinase
MTTLVVAAPAKLNLFLHVIGRRPDGYHELESLMVLIDFGDTLGLRLRDDGEIRRSVGPPGVAADDDLCVRAARLLQAKSGCALGVDIRLEKRIPLGSGMGGASSDAASTLLALNRLWRLDLSRAALMSLALQLGADVPFFVFGRPAFAAGIGERLAAVTMPPLVVAVAAPPVAVPTASIFAAAELKRDTPRVDIPAFALDFGRNDLQSVALARHPQITACLEGLDGAARDLGLGQACARARMTGSGASTFCILPHSSIAARFTAALAARAPVGTLCLTAQTLSRHPLDGLGQK